MFFAAWLWRVAHGTRVMLLASTLGDVMGAGTETMLLHILQQAKKAQGETNERLDAFIRAQLETNRLLLELSNRLPSVR